MAWSNSNSGSETHPVGQLNANDFGLYDMSGNVGEWVADTYHDSYNGAPTDGSIWGGSDTRVLRGGSWGSSPLNMRAANRFNFDPAARNYGNGFRLARTHP
jgi:formylglycine-generating enzyme required for sulfatase activity